MTKKNIISHDRRKNPKSKEAYDKQRKERNQGREKQVFDKITKEWSR